MRPLIYVYEDQIRELFKQQRHASVSGAAFVWDEGTVFHAYTRPPKIRPAGIPCKCLFQCVESVQSLHECEAYAEAMLGLEENASERPVTDQVLSIFLVIGATGTLHHRAFVRLSGSLVEGDIRFVPERSELYSRSKGLLETAVLEQKQVMIIGLGSGGSLVAIELAKAGVGHFLLIDFDRLELSNISRHICGISDLGRFKTVAVRDAIWQKNPFAQVKTFEIDINESVGQFQRVAEGSDLLICASDNDRSRLNVNAVSLKCAIPAIYGRAITRAAGGDVLCVRPFVGPCYNCLFSQRIIQSEEQEFSHLRQVREAVPAYVRDEQALNMVQVGLSSDIAPIANMMVKLSLVELSRGLPSGIASLEHDLIAPYYIWANRRERTYANLPTMAYEFNKPTILRWYGARVERDAQCRACGVRTEALSDDNMFSA